MNITLIEGLQVARSMNELPHRVKLLWSTDLASLPWRGYPFPFQWLTDSSHPYPVKMDNFWGRESEQIEEGQRICWSRWCVVFGDGEMDKIEVYDVFYTGTEIPGICRHGAWAFCTDPDTNKEWAMQLLVSDHSEVYDEVSDSYTNSTPKIFYDFLALADEFAALRRPLIRPYFEEIDAVVVDNDRTQRTTCESR